MVEPTLGDRAYIRLDPALDPAVSSLWASPLGDRLEFTFIDFEGGLTESVTPNYVETEIYGRAEPYKAFINLPSKEIQIRFTFQAQEGDPQAEVVDPGRFLDGLKYPLYSEAQNINYPPPACLLRIGTLFFGRVLLTGGDPQWKGPVTTETFLPHTCEFDATFSIVRRFQADLSYRFDGVWQ